MNDSLHFTCHPLPFFRRVVIFLPALFYDPGKPFDRGRILVGKEGTLRLVQCGDSFHVQTSDLDMEELIRSSSLPCFTTDLGRSRRKMPAEQIEIPIKDPEADLVFLSDHRAEVWILHQQPHL